MSEGKKLKGFVVRILGEGSKGGIIRAERGKKN